MSLSFFRVTINVVKFLIWSFVNFDLNNISKISPLICQKYLIIDYLNCKIFTTPSPQIYVLHTIGKFAKFSSIFCSAHFEVKKNNNFETSYFFCISRFTYGETRKILEESGDPDRPVGKIFLCGKNCY